MPTKLSINSSSGEKSVFSLLCFVLWAYCAFVSPITAADEILFKAEYEGKYSGMTITSTRTLIAKDASTFLVESRMKNILGSITEKSNFKFENGVMQPSEYRYTRSVIGFKADEKISFDWDSKTARYERKDKPEKNREHKLEPGVLDPVLYQLQMQREAFSGKDAFRLTFVKPSKVQTLLFHKTADEALTVGAKDYPAIKFERINLDDLKKTRIWLIPELNYQIGRIEHIEEDGDSYNIFLKSYTASPKLVSNIYQASTP
ncbi:DUF3108 domain-containing protein [Teredinibacter haidensis]|uniref:DUF3108 domain-containing protein n=1 Tax=Teredinibacter haidensis TaxID=2731755 RepID=UPI000A654014|nr:DUF3108 domain-containing protein [Teredinibacter haidensis]